jgi:exodeoxyribonuclease VII small subunit
VNNQELEALSFEQAMAELDRIVKLLDAGDVSLEESITLYQQGVTLSAICTAKLDEIEKRVQILTHPGLSDQSVDFVPDTTSEA